LELAKKKKQALDDLFNSGKISASTYESLDKELTSTISEIEARQKDIAEKMTSNIAALEKQISTLELFLANSEIQYAAGEIDEDLHANEIGAYTLGLDAVKQQLSAIKEVVAGLMPEVVAPTPPPTPSKVEEAQPTEEVIRETLEAPVETPTETLVEMPVEEPIEEPLEASEEIVAEEVTPVEEAPSEEEALEETAEETVATEEVVAETYTEETATEEEIETETSAEETSSYEEEEETTEEETYE